MQEAVPTAQKRPPLLAAANCLSPPGIAGMTSTVRVSMSWPTAASTTSLKCFKKTMPIFAKLVVKSQSELTLTPTLDEPACGAM
jgi:hypothetical protein